MVLHIFIRVKIVLWTLLDFALQRENWKKDMSSSRTFIRLLSMAAFLCLLLSSYAFNWAPHHEGMYLCAFFTSALDGGEWSASCPGHFIPRERAPGTQWIGGWVGPCTGNCKWFDLSEVLIRELRNAMRNFIQSSRCFDLCSWYLPNATWTW
jgi:hypothetical protein